MHVAQKHFPERGAYTVPSPQPQQPPGSGANNNSGVVHASKSPTANSSSPSPFQSSPLKPSDSANVQSGNDNGNHSGNLGDSQSGSFGSGNPTSSNLTAQHSEEFRLAPFIPPVDSISPMLQWSSDLDYLAKIGSTCKHVDAELAKAEAPKSHLLRIGVPAWDHKKTERFKSKDIPETAEKPYQPPLEQLLSLVTVLLHNKDHADTLDFLSEAILQSSIDSRVDAGMEDAYNAAPPTPKHIQKNAAASSTTTQ